MVTEREKNAPQVSWSSKSYPVACFSTYNTTSYPGRVYPSWHMRYWSRFDYRFGLKKSNMSISSIWNKMKKIVRTLRSVRLYVYVRADDRACLYEPKLTGGSCERDARRRIELGICVHVIQGRVYSPTRDRTSIPRAPPDLNRMHIRVHQQRRRQPLNTQNKKFKHISKPKERKKLT